MADRLSAAAVTQNDVISAIRHFLVRHIEAAQDLEESRNVLPRECVGSIDDVHGPLPTGDGEHTLLAGYDILTEYTVRDLRSCAEVPKKRVNLLGGQEEVVINREEEVAVA